MDASSNFRNQGIPPYIDDSDDEEYLTEDVVTPNHNPQSSTAKKQQQSRINRATPEAKRAGKGFLFEDTQGVHWRHDMVTDVFSFKHIHLKGNLTMILPRTAVLNDALYFRLEYEAGHRQGQSVSSCGQSTHVNPSSNTSPLMITNPVQRVDYCTKPDGNTYTGDVRAIPIIGTNAIGLRFFCTSGEKAHGNKPNQSIWLFSVKGILGGCKLKKTVLRIRVKSNLDDCRTKPTIARLERHLQPIPSTSSSATPQKRKLLSTSSTPPKRTLRTRQNNITNNNDCISDTSTTTIPIYSSTPTKISPLQHVNPETTYYDSILTSTKALLHKNYDQILNTLSPEQLFHEFARQLPHIKKIAAQTKLASEQTENPHD